MIVVYSSKTGSSKAYAEALASRIGCRCIPVGETVPEGEQIVFVGWLRFDMISGIRSIDRRSLKAVCVVGLDDDARFSSARSKIASRNQVTAPMFHLRGWIDRSRLNLMDRTALAFVAAMMKLRGLDGPSQKVFDAMMEGGSFFDESRLDQVVRFLNPTGRSRPPSRASR